MSKFLHDNDNNLDDNDVINAKVIAIPPVFYKNSQAKNDKKKIRIRLQDFQIQDLVATISL